MINVSNEYIQERLTPRYRVEHIGIVQSQLNHSRLELIFCHKGGGHTPKRVFSHPQLSLFSFSISIEKHYRGSSIEKRGPSSPLALPPLPFKGSLSRYILSTNADSLVIDNLSIILNDSLSISCILLITKTEQLK